MHYAMEENWAADAQIHVSLASEVVADDWPASNFSRFIPEEKSPLNM
jgi:hypothetical protein